MRTARVSMLVRYLKYNRLSPLPPPISFTRFNFKREKWTRTWKVILHKSIRKTRQFPKVFGNCDATVDFCPKKRKNPSPQEGTACGRWDVGEKSRPFFLFIFFTFNGKENRTISFYKWNMFILLFIKPQIGEKCKNIFWPFCCWKKILVKRTNISQ